jgi:rfaE bifunctional protein kinase chain/domain/rfaE bifunctional protein nucleotidyltransferase chain/domain
MADTANQKVKELDDLAKIVARLRAKGKRVAQCHGVFDLLHVGHVRHFQKAREFGDVLIVTLTPDEFVNKGPNRPAFNQALRAELLANLQGIDYVAVNRWPSAVEAIKLLKPDFYVKGSDYKDAEKDVTGGITLEREAIESVGGKLAFTDDIVFSSSHVLNRHMPAVPKQAAEYLVEFSRKHPADELIGYLTHSRKLRVLVIGETIVDDYHYCETLGKSGKEPILAVRYKSREQFAGGAIALANHVASFCDNVDLISALGSEDSQEDFIRAKLNSRVRPTFIYQVGAPTIIKRRFIESYPFQKMFEVYLMNEDADEPRNAARLCEMLEARVADYDLVIVGDFGHHLLEAQAIEILCRKAKCLAVNTQSNAANHGFNTASKYARADYYCISEKEIRLEARQRREDITQIITKVATKLSSEKLIVTRGRAGLLCYGKDEPLAEVPAMAGHFVDRVGAGDAVFAVTSLCMRQGAPAAVLGVIGNAVGAMAVGTVGNSAAIDNIALMKFLASVLK